MPWAELCKHKAVKKAANVFLSGGDVSARLFPGPPQPHICILCSSRTIPAESCSANQITLTGTYQSTFIGLVLFQNVPASDLECSPSSLLIFRQKQDRFSHRLQNVNGVFFFFSVSDHSSLAGLSPEDPFWAHSLKAMAASPAPILLYSASRDCRKAIWSFSCSSSCTPAPAGCWTEILHLARLIYKHVILCLWSCSPQNF